MDEKDVKKLIRQELKNSFAQKRIGDTPTDALQLVNKKYVDEHSGGLLGQVSSSGTGIVLPTGWSSSGGGGSYTVTHNLGTTAYIVLATSFGNLATWSIVSTQSANNFTVTTLVGNGTQTSGSFNFALFQI